MLKDRCRVHFLKITFNLFLFIYSLKLLILGLEMNEKKKQPGIMLYTASLSYMTSVGHGSFRDNESLFPYHFLSMLFEKYPNPF